MSRGGRRRKGKRGRRGPGSSERRSGAAEQDFEDRESQPLGRRRDHPRDGAAREVSILDQMTSRPVQLQTLPPDGTVLEELIGAMQSEYGVPTTPQEYRLIVKTPVPEEQTDPSIDLKSATPAPPPEEQTQASGPRAGRRRRRNRRRGSGSEEEDTDVMETED